MALGGIDRFQQVAKFGFVQANDVLAQKQNITVGNRSAYRGKIILPDGTIVAVDVVLVHRFRRGWRRSDVFFAVSGVSHGQYSQAGSCRREKANRF
jgi:hypothetical protein